MLILWSNYFSNYVISHSLVVFDTWEEPFADNRWDCGGSENCIRYAPEESWNGPSSRCLYCSSWYIFDFPFNIHCFTMSSISCFIRSNNLIPCMKNFNFIMYKYIRWLWHSWRTAWSYYMGSAWNPSKTCKESNIHHTFCSSCFDYQNRWNVSSWLARW